MDNKYIVGIVGVVVAIILVGSLLTPVINDLSKGESETIEAENPIGLPVKYDVANPNLSGTVSFYNFTVEEQYDDDNNVIDYLLQLSAGSNTASSLRSSLPDKFIVYSDNNTTIYIDGNKIQSSELNITGDITGADNFFQVYYRNGSYSYRTDAGNINAPTPISYYYRMCSSGDYSNFAGDNPPAMDTPAASINGVYIGEKYITITGDSPYASLYGAIVVIVLASILIASVGYFISTKRE